MRPLIKENQISSEIIIKIKRMISKFFNCQVDYTFSKSEDNKNHSRAFSNEMKFLYFYNEDLGDILARIDLTTHELISFLKSEEEEEIKKLLKTYGR